MMPQQGISCLRFCQNRAVSKPGVAAVQMSKAHNCLHRRRLAVLLAVLWSAQHCALPAHALYSGWTSPLAGCSSSGAAPHMQGILSQRRHTSRNLPQSGKTMTLTPSALPTTHARHSPCLPQGTTPRRPPSWAVRASQPAAAPTRPLVPASPLGAWLATRPADFAGVFESWTPPLPAPPRLSHDPQVRSPITRVTPSHARPGSWPPQCARRPPPPTPTRIVRPPRSPRPPEASHRCTLCSPSLAISPPLPALIPLVMLLRRYAGRSGQLRASFWRQFQQLLVFSSRRQLTGFCLRPAFSQTHGTTRLVLPQLWRLLEPGRCDRQTAAAAATARARLNSAFLQRLLQPFR